MYSPLKYAPQILLKNRPVQFTFFVTSRCNARCPFCFYWRGRHSKRRELDLDEIEKISRGMGSLLWLLFSGGEIFLRRDFVDIAGSFYRNNRPAIITLPTNGLAPDLIIPKTEAILALASKSAVVVKVSLDGLGDEHDRIRNTPGSFEKALETWGELSHLRDRFPNLQIGINTVFCRENQDHMDQIIDFVNNLPGCETHTISLVRGDPAAPETKDIDLEKYRRAIMRLESDLKGASPKMYHFNLSRIKSAQDLVQRRLIYETVRQGRRQLPCFAGRLALVMNEVGDVFPCEILDQQMGNIREAGYDMMKIYRSSPADAVRAQISNSRCYCSHECYFVTNILFNPLIHGKVIRQYAGLPRPAR